MSGISSLTSNLTSSLASSLFSRLDTKKHGYLDRSDLENAFSVSGTASDNSTSSIDDLFSTLDSNGDGKVTESELQSGLQTLSDALDDQMGSLRMNEAMGGMPPPPPAADDEGFTLDELMQQLSALTPSNATSEADSDRSNLISSIVANFDQADVNGDGKVSLAEAMAFADTNGMTPGASSSQSVYATNETAGSNSDGMMDTSANDADMKVMLQILQLAQSYGIVGTTTPARDSSYAPISAMA